MGMAELAPRPEPEPPRVVGSGAPLIVVVPVRATGPGASGATQDEGFSITVGEAGSARATVLKWDVTIMNLRLTKCSGHRPDVFRAG